RICRWRLGRIRRGVLGRGTGPPPPLTAPPPPPPPVRPHPTHPPRGGATPRAGRPPPPPRPGSSGPPLPPLAPPRPPPGEARRDLRPAQFDDPAQLGWRLDVVLQRVEPGERPALQEGHGMEVMVQVHDRVLRVRDRRHDPERPVDPAVEGARDAILAELVV